VRIVQKDGADNTRTFTTLDAAMTSITDASPTNPYLVKVMPGWFGGTPGKPYVTIEGSGASQTFISIGGLNNETVRDVTLQNPVDFQQGAVLERVNVTSGYAIGVYINAVNSGSPQLQMGSLS